MAHKAPRWIGLFVVLALRSIFPVQAQEAMYTGRPTFRAGIDRSYFVWKDGDEWNVRWTTIGKMLRFTGSVIAEGGKLRSLDRIDV